MRVVLPDPPDPASDTVTVIAAVVDTARAVVPRAGAARVGEVTGRVAADLAVWVDDELVTAVVSEPADFVWLERRTGWFYLPSVAKNAIAVSRVAKVLSVAGEVTLSDLHAGIAATSSCGELRDARVHPGRACARLAGERDRERRPGGRRPPAPPPRRSSRSSSSRCCGARRFPPPGVRLSGTELRTAPVWAAG